MRKRIALISEHASPLALLGGVDSGGQNVYVGQLARLLGRLGFEVDVFTRRDGTLRHFWSGEMTGGTADPGQDPRGAPDPAPLWAVLDQTPEGRGTDWYPSLSYD